MKIVVALTGGSGSPYFLSLVKRLEAAKVVLDLVSSASGRLVLEHETGVRWDSFTAERSVHNEDDMAAKIASGSNRTHAMVVVPCSMSTLSHIAYGTSVNLIHRAAAVQLKERRKLIVVPRETPYSLVHLRAMTQLTEAGGIVLPASPGFYNKPKGIEDLVNGVVDRILDNLDCPDSDIKRWEK